MPRFLAIEWDAREARVAVVRTRAAEVTLEEAFAIPFPPRGDATDVAPDAKIGSVIQDALTTRGLTRIDTLVAVGRASIELRVLTLPPAPPEEVPDLVRFQATKQFTTAGENWPLDFVPLSQETESQTVLAAAISTELVGQIKKTCATAHLEPQRLVLRPFASAALWRRRVGGSRCTLMVDLLTDEADLTVLVDGHVGFVRTVRLPVSAEGDEFFRALSSEIRRTIGAASNQLRGQRVERIVLCGTLKDHGTLPAQLAQQTSLEVECFDPLVGLTLTPELQSSLPPRAGRFAPLIGMLLDEAAGDPHGIDFLHPRKRPVPVNNQRRNILIGAAVATVVLAIAFLQWWQFTDLEAKVVSLRKQVAELDSSLKKLQPTLTEVQDIDSFTAGDITWLDELYRLSEHFLPAEDSIAAELALNFSVRQKGGGQLLAEGYVKQHDMIDMLERKLRDERHKVSSPSASKDEKSETFPWHFKETVNIEPEDVEERFVAKRDSKVASPAADKSMTGKDAAGKKGGKAR